MASSLKRWVGLVATMLAVPLAACDYQYHLSSSNGIPANALTRTAEPLLAAFKTGDTEKAATELNRIGGTRDETRSYIRLYQLTSIRSVTWTKVSYINGSKAKLEGTASLRDGGSNPIFLEFVKDDGAWAVQFVNVTVKTEKAAPDKLPDGPAAAALARASMEAVLEAARRKTMAPVYEQGAGIFKSFKTVAEYDAQSSSLFDLTVTGDPLLGRTPIFDALPKLRPDGLLVLEGHYDLGSTRALFAFAYAFEDGQWRIASFDFRTKSIPMVNAALETDR